MTLLHHRALCRLPSLEFPCSGFSFSLLNIFHNLTAIHLNPPHNFWQPLLPTPLYHCACYPTTFQTHLTIASYHVLSRR